jgi:hypothetical protein
MGSGAVGIKIEEMKKAAMDLSNPLKINLDYSSSVRRGKVRKLMLGELPVYDRTYSSNLSVVSTAKGIACMPQVTTRFCAETFPVCLKTSIPYNQLYLYKSRLGDLMNKFIQREEKEVLARIVQSEDVLFAKNEDVKRLQKFFKGLGKNVAVLPDGKIFDFTENNFELIIRTDVSVDVSNNPSNMTMDLAVWEQIGFVFETDDVESLKLVED